MAYCVVCPDIDPLATATADFFQQLGTGELHQIVILVKFVKLSGNFRT